MAANKDDLDWALAVIEPALVLCDRGFLLEMRTRLAAEGVAAAAVLDRDSAVIYDWLLRAMQHQGISDAAAEAFIHTNAPVGWAGISDTLPVDGRPACPKLNSYWHFDGCGYRKTARTCAEPALLEACPLPRQPLRNGRLSQGAYSLLLFIRDVCDGDIVGWIDARLARADRLADPQHRAAAMRQAVLEPMRNIYGVSDKVLAMALSTLLMGAANGRERWLTTGIGMIVIDTLVHNFLHRTGILQRLKANHPYGPGCYGAGGCADIVAALADRIDARRFNPNFPACFPRFVQHALWRFCAQGQFDICNGNRIDDRQPCRSTCCPAAGLCCRVALHDTSGQRRTAPTDHLARR